MITSKRFTRPRKLAEALKNLIRRKSVSRTMNLSLLSAIRKVGRATTAVVVVAILILAGMTRIMPTEFETMSLVPFSQMTNLAMCGDVAGTTQMAGTFVRA